MDNSGEGSKGFVDQCKRINEHLEKAHAIVNEIISPELGINATNAEKDTVVIGSADELSRELTCALVSVDKLVSRLGTISQRF